MPAPKILLFITKYKYLKKIKIFIFLTICFMNLNENYKKRLMELAGILKEADHRSVIINKIKMPQIVADWAHGLSDKYSIWIANTFKDEFLKSAFPDEIRHSVEKTLELNQPALISRMNNKRREMTPMYRHILDWLSRRNQIAIETDQIDFKKLTYTDALERSNKWHEEVSKIKSGKIEDEDGEVIINYPDGFYWIDLGKSICDKEADAMGHCGRGSSYYSVLYSLRKDGYPHVTADVDSVTEELLQLRGRANSKPSEKYHPYIVDFLTSGKVKIKDFNYNNYRPEDNFYPRHLSQELKNKLFNKRPDLQDIYAMTYEEIDELITKHPELKSKIEISKLLIENFDVAHIIFLMKKHEGLKSSIENLYVELSDAGVEPFNYGYELAEIAKDFPELNDHSIQGIHALLGTKGGNWGKFVESINRDSKPNKIENGFIHWYFNNYEDLSFFFEKDSESFIKDFFNGEVWFGEGDYDWENAIDDINEKNLEHIKKLLLSNGVNLDEYDLLEDAIKESESDDIIYALESATRDGHAVGEENEYYKIIMKSLKGIGLEMDNVDYETYEVIINGEKKKRDRQIVKISTSVLYSYLENFLETIIYDYGLQFSIEEVLKVGLNEANEFASPNFDYVYGDFDKVAFNERLYDELPELKS
jgi:hypothetical protein